jgi:hypothetical protein
MVVIGVTVSITHVTGMTFADKALPLVFDMQFQLKVNQTFSVDSDGIAVKFLNVTADSRCPSDVTCFWQGETKILVSVVQNNQDRGNFILTSRAGQQNLTVQVFDGYFIHVVKVEPYTLSGKKISPSDYLVTFVMTKFGISSPLHQFKSGINSSDVKCTSIFQLVINAADGSPACVTPSTAQKLVERGWAKSPSSGTHPDSTKIVTLQQNNQEISLQKGQRFLLNLGSNYDWSLNIDNNTVISRVPNIMVMQGAQGLFEAYDEGKTTLEATGDPLCLKATPRCAMPSILFKINVTVS